MNWFEYVKKKGVPRWPYPICYGQQEAVESEVLVLGGGIAGCWAAIAAAQRGAAVVLVEKGATIRSGAAGSGCDHWLNTPHPGSPCTAREMVDWEVGMTGGYTNTVSRYIAARESFATLLEMEQLGGKIRDDDDTFSGAPFRDESTKFLFAYDYDSKIHFRVWGSTFKQALFKACKKLKVRIYDRIMAVGLLTEKGRTGARVVGATGLNGRTGAFYTFKAKAVINAMSRHQRNWCFSTELRGNANFRPTQIVGDGHAMAWRAGARFTMMEKSLPTSFASGNTHLHYGHGNALNTWVPCTLVDARGKQIPWVDRDGQQLDALDQRVRPAPGQKFMGERTLQFDYKRPEPIPDLLERIKKGEYELPLYADLPGMPDHERKAIWGLMVGEEGKSRIPVHQYYTEAGFDPAQDLLQSYMFLGSDPMRASVRPQDRTGGEIGDAGGLVADSRLMTNIEGLFAAGDALFAANYHYHAAATGRYAGRQAAAFAGTVAAVTPHRPQVAQQKAWAYAPLAEKGDLEWKEVNAALCKIMQDYCGEFKNEELLALGLTWLADMQTNELPRINVDTPHKLMRTLEVHNILTCNEMILHASLARKASTPVMGFARLDYPQIDAPGWKKWILLNRTADGVETAEMPLDFGSPLDRNYEKHFV